MRGPRYALSHGMIGYLRLQIWLFWVSISNFRGGTHSNTQNSKQTPPLSANSALILNLAGHRETQHEQTTHIQYSKTKSGRNWDSICGRHGRTHLSFPSRTLTSLSLEACNCYSSYQSQVMQHGKNWSQGTSIEEIYFFCPYTYTILKHLFSYR